MTQLVNKSLGDIVSEHNSTAAIFNKYHLDYCSLGDLPLSEYLANTDISLGQLPDELKLAIDNEPADNINFNALSLTEISQIIRNTYHEYLRNKISELSTLSQKVKNKHEIEEVDKIHELLLSIFNYLAPHILKEEKTLFPYLEYMEHTVLKGKMPKPPSFGKVKQSVSSMIDDHRDSTENLNKLRELTKNYLCPKNTDDDIRRFYRELNYLDKNLRMHIHIENNVLFKKARAMEEKIISEEG